MLGQGKRFVRLATLALLCILSACTTSTVNSSRYVRDGVQYGTTEGRFRARWWNYYERGRSFLEGGFYVEAEKDLRLALAGRGRDQIWARTYGLHLTPEYFPHRELGIALYSQDRTQDSIPELESSLKQRYSARGAYYLNLARRQWLQSSNADREAPSVVILAPTDKTPFGTDAVEIKGIARDDSYVAAIQVGDSLCDVKVSAPEVPFSCPVTLRPGSNKVMVTVTDLVGKKTVVPVEVSVDIDGPSVSFDAPVVFPGTITGVLADVSPVARMVIAEQEVTLTPQGNGLVGFSCTVGRQDRLCPLSYRAEDALGNLTEGIVPVEVATLGRLPEGPVFARNDVSLLSLGTHLTALVANGMPLAVARVPENPERLRVELANLHDHQPFYVDEIVVNVNVTGTIPVKGIALNGEAVESIPNRASQRLARRVRLHEGANQITVTVEDTEGRKAQDVKNIERVCSDLDKVKAKLGIAFLGNVARSQGTHMAEEAEGILDKLAAAASVNKRFTVVDRSLLHELLREQELSQAIASKKGELALCKIVPAEVMFVARVRRDQLSTEIVLEGTSTETGIRIAPRVDVAGPSDQLERLVDDLGLRLNQEFPRAKGLVIEGATLVPGQATSEKEPVGFVSDGANEQDPVLAAEADDVLHQLASLPAVTDRFAVVDRDLLKNIAAEKSLAQALATRESRLAEGSPVPARVLFSIRLIKTQDGIEITAESLSTKRGDRIGAPILVKGTASELNHMVEELGERLVEETPRTVASEPPRAEGKVTLDLGRTKGVREYLKCLLYRFEDVVDPRTKERIGTKPVVLCEGLITGVSDNASAAAVFPWEGQTADIAKTIEAGCHVVTK